MKKIICSIIILLTLFFVGCDSKLKEEYEDLRLKYEELEKLNNENLSSSLEKYSDLENRYNKLEEKYNDLDESNSENQSYIARLEEEQEKLKEEYENIKSNKDELETKYQDLEQENKNMESSYNELKENQEELEQKYDEVLDKVDSYENEERYILNKYVENIKKLYFDNIFPRTVYLEPYLKREVVWAVSFEKICALIELKEESVYVCRYYDMFTKEEKWALYKEFESIEKTFNTLNITGCYEIIKAAIVKDVITNEYINLEFSLYTVIPIDFTEDENKFSVTGELVEKGQYLDFISKEKFSQLNSKDSIIDRAIKYDEMNKENGEAYVVEEYMEEQYIRLNIGCKYPQGDIMDYLKDEFENDIDFARGKILFEDSFIVDAFSDVNKTYYVLFSIEHFIEYYNLYAQRKK